MVWTRTDRHVRGTSSDLQLQMTHPMQVILKTNTVPSIFKKWEMSLNAWGRISLTFTITGTGGDIVGHYFHEVSGAHSLYFYDIISFVQCFTCGQFFFLENFQTFLTIFKQRFICPVSNFQQLLIEAGEKSIQKRRRN